MKYILIISIFLLALPLFGSIGKPEMIFITKEDQLILGISDTIEIIKVLNLIKNQNSCKCMADYAAYVYYSKDSVDILPIWKDNCENGNESQVFKYIKNRNNNRTVIAVGSKVCTKRYFIIGRHLTS